ncbi:VanZ family protein [Gelidibacter salicanalis]|uniref:VanZ family protein n=1 Tax=Gelidibacter salicanalis TaxID=291193 RepID=A0A934KR03_9FLAO|nr:VanZ family protein [Gelidibacter salicanalis]MBJ7882214.1 VanZ family protein [Gelidibacter salicanalis]
MHKHFALALLVAYAAVLLVLSLVTLGNIQTLGSSFDDKIYHAGAYFVLTLLVFNYLNTLEVKNAFLYAFAAAALYGVLMELFQNYLTTTRTFDGYDMVANIFGAIFAVLLVAFYRKLKLK